MVASATAVRVVGALEETSIMLVSKREENDLVQSRADLFLKDENIIDRDLIL